MVKFIFLFLSLFVFEGIHAQLNPQKGDWTKKKIGSIHLGFISSDTSSVYTINDRNFGSPVLTVFDKNALNFLRDIQLKTNPGGNEPERLTHAFSLKNRLFSIIEKTTTEGEILILVRRVEENVENALTVCLDTLPKNNVKGEYDIIVNGQENAFAFVNQQPINNRNLQKVNIATYDQSLNQIWKHSVEFQNNEKQFVLSNWKFLNKTDITFIGRPIVDLYKPQSELTSSSQNSYYLFKYNHGNDLLQEIELSLNSKFINEIDYIISDSNCLVSGIFSMNNSLQADGVFSLVFDARLRRTNHTIHRFTPDEIANFSTQYKKKGSGRSISKKNFINELLIRDFILLQNGEFILLAEEFGKEWEDPLNSSKQESLKTSSYLYYYRNIHVFWYNSSGTMKSVRTIQKNQMARDAFNKYNSFITAKNKDEIVVFYNETPKNLERHPSESKATASNKKMFVQYVRLKSKGAISKAILTQPSKREKVKVNLGAQLLDGKVYFILQKGWGKKSLLKVDIEE